MQNSADLVQGLTRNLHDSYNIPIGMAKISLYLDARTKNKYEVYPIKIAIRHNGSVCYLPTSIKTAKSEWMDGNIVPSSPANRRLNQILQEKVAFLRFQLLSLISTRDIGDLNAKEVANLIDPDLKMGKDRENRVLLVDFFERVIERKEKTETKAVYVQTRNRIARFCADWARLKFEDITYAWLCDFEAWMVRDGCAVNTRSIHMRNLRAVYNQAIRENVVDGGAYPFRNFRIKKEETIKRSLTVEQLRALRAAPCDDCLRKFVDAFFLIFYLAGINVVDLLELPPLEADGRIRYRRSKTGVVCELLVPPEAREIIDRYRGRDHLVCWGEEYASKRSFTLRLNQGLQRVGEVRYVGVKARNGATHMAKRYKPMFAHITSYWARHTWATLASEIDVPDAVIDAALGHKSPYPMADVYIRRNGRKVDDAVRRVIEYVKGNKIIS